MTREAKPLFEYFFQFEDLTRKVKFMSDLRTELMSKGFAPPPSASNPDHGKWERPEADLKWEALGPDYAVSSRVRRELQHDRYRNRQFNSVEVATSIGLRRPDDRSGVSACLHSLKTTGEIRAVSDPGTRPVIYERVRVPADAIQNRREKTTRTRPSKLMPPTAAAEPPVVVDTIEALELATIDLIGRYAALVKAQTVDLTTVPMDDLLAEIKRRSPA